MSYMTEKETALWKEQYITSIMDANGDLTIPAFHDFRMKLLTDFAPVNQTRDAMNKLETLRQGNKIAKELVTEFCLLVGQAGLSQTSANFRDPQLHRKYSDPLEILHTDTSDV